MKHIVLSSVLLMAFAIPVFTQNKTLLDSLYDIGTAHTKAGNFQEAMPVLLEAQKIAEAQGNLRYQCKIQIHFAKIGAVSENNQALEDAVKKGLEICTTCKDTASLARILLLKGIWGLKQKQYDEAIRDFKTSSAYYLLRGDSVGSASALSKIGNALELTGKYEEAQVYYRRLYDIATQRRDSFSMLSANIFLTSNYEYLGQPQKALEYNKVAKALARQIGAKHEYSAALRNEAIIYGNLGKYKEAYFALLDEFIPYYQDTLLNAERLNDLENLKAQYESEKKEAQIAAQQTQLKQARQIFWAVTAGLILALLAGAALFLLSRRLRKSNREKEFLIKEIHHRVKNNLQILSSLLHLQSRQITDDAALDAVRTGQSRVDAMGLMHQKLYMGDNMAKVEMKDYLEQFGQNMLDSFGLDDGRINIRYDMQPMYLDVDIAIPLGLIINELLTNSLKYAFPGGREGTVTIALWKGTSGYLNLRVSDDGVGLAAATSDKNSTAFGTNLVQMLSKKLKGKPERPAVAQGYATEIQFAITV